MIWHRRQRSIAEPAASSRLKSFAAATTLYLAWGAGALGAVAAIQSLIFLVVDGIPLWRSELHPVFFLVNGLLVAACGGVAFAVLGRWAAAQALTGSVVLLVVLAHLGKLLTLGRPLYLTDLGATGQVLKLLPVLAGTLRPLLFAAGFLLLIAAAAVMLGWRFPVRRATRAERIVVGVLACAFLAVSTHWTHVVPEGSRLDETLREDLWGGRDYYVRKGFLLAATLQLSLRLRAPREYGPELVAETLARNRLLEPQPAPPPELPDLILYLGEAFWDPTQLPVVFNRDPIPHFRRLLDGPVGGQILVPVYGGLTPQTEFEVLTGLSTASLPAGAVVYQRYLTRSLPGLPSFLRQLGYHTTAVHTHVPWYWDRRRALPLLGFERFISSDDLKSPRKAGPFISDEVLVDRIIEECALASPCFVFGISMATHGPYRRHDREELPVKVVSGLHGTARETLEVYASRLLGADEAIGRLVETLQRWPRPVVLAIFGDHLPLLGNNFEIYTQTGFVRTFREDRVKLHTAPVAIWANFPLTPQRIDARATSLGVRLFRHAGLPLPVSLCLAERVDEISPPRTELPSAQKSDWSCVGYDLLAGAQHTARLDPYFGEPWLAAQQLTASSRIEQQRRRPPQIVEYGPRDIFAGETHLLQPDGHSVLWVKTRNTSSVALLELNDQALPTTHGEGGLLTAAIPHGVLDTPGDYSLRVRDPSRRLQSSPVIIRVMAREESRDEAVSPVVHHLPRLVSWGPTSATAGTPFNQQADGSSALWFQFDSPPHHVSITLAGETAVSFVSPSGLVSATIPRAPLTPGRYPVVLTDSSTGAQLAELWFEVVPAAPPSQPHAE